MWSECVCGSNLCRHFFFQHLSRGSACMAWSWSKSLFKFDTRHDHMMWLSQIINSEYYLVFTACFQPQPKLPLHTFNNASSSCSVTRSTFHTSCSLETHQSGRRWWWWGSWSRAPRRYHVHFISSRQNHFFDNVDELQQHVSWFLSAYMSNIDGHWFLKGYQCSRYLET